MKSYLGILIVCLAGCAQQPSSTELPKGAKEDSRFTSAKLSSDGTTGIFVFKREIYYPGGVGPFFSGFERRYLRNQSIIGSYNITSGNVRVIYRRDNKNRYIHEDADFQIREVQGPTALVSDDYQKYYWLDINLGKLAPLPDGNPNDIFSTKTSEQVIEFQVDSHGSRQPKIGRKVDGKWRYEEARIDTKDLR